MSGRVVINMDDHLEIVPISLMETETAFDSSGNYDLPVQTSLLCTKNRAG
jgi:hypothetical protein